MIAYWVESGVNALRPWVQISAATSQIAASPQTAVVYVQRAFTPGANIGWPGVPGTVLGSMNIKEGVMAPEPVGNPRPGMSKIYRQRLDALDAAD